MCHRLSVVPVQHSTSGHFIKRTCQTVRCPIVPHVIQGLEYHYFQHYTPCSAGLLHLSDLELAAVGHFALLSKITKENEGLQSCCRYACLFTSSRFARRMKTVRRHTSTYAEHEERTLGRVLKGGRKKPLKLG